MEKLESSMTEAQRAVYNEDKRINRLLRVATQENEAAAEMALIDLRKLFYEKKRALEAIQKLPKDAAGKDYAELGRLSNICTNIVALFKDLGLGLQERSYPVPQASRRPQSLQRRYLGLGEDL